MPKKIVLAFPPGLLEEVDFVARAEHRTRSDLIREALRRYIENVRRQGVPIPSRVNPQAEYADD
jgi:metal-responsive CopG/Arc/MetJ family transcriptional regulator